MACYLDVNNYLFLNFRMGKIKKDRCGNWIRLKNWLPIEEIEPEPHFLNKVSAADSSDGSRNTLSQ